MDIENANNLKFNGEQILRGKNTETNDFTDKKKNLNDLTENYKSFKKDDIIDQLYGERVKKEIGSTHNDIMGKYDEKNEYLEAKESYLSSDKKIKDNSNEENEYSFTEKSNLSLEEINKKSTSSHSIYDESALTTNVNIEENLFREMAINTYNDYIINAVEINKDIPLKESKDSLKENFLGYDNIKNEKRNSEEKIKYIYKTYTPAPIPQTEKTDIWLIDTVNEILDKLCDLNKRYKNSNNFDIIQKSLNDDSFYTKLIENIKMKWPDNLKLNNLIYYNHILNIYESVNKIFISDEEKNFFENKNSIKSSSMPLPKFPFKDLKDRCSSKSYKNLPELKVFSDKNEILQYKNTKDDKFFNIFFKNFVDIIKNKYKEFSDNVREELEKAEKKNYSFKEYCMEMSKVLAINVINMISLSKLPVMLNNILESAHSCIKYESEENIEDNVMNSSDNIQLYDDMERICSLPQNSCNTTFNLNTILQSSNIQNKTNPLNSNKTNKNSLSTQQEKYIYTNNFSALPKYTKTYANSRCKLNSTFRAYNISKYKEIKGNAYINTDLPFGNKVICFPLENKNIYENKIKNEKGNNNSSEICSDRSTKLLGDTFKIDSNNYYTVNSLPFEDSIKLENL